MNFKVELNSLKEKGLLRKNQTYVPIDGAYVFAEGKKCLMLASNNYLGMTHERKVRQAAITAIEAYGTGSGGARLTTGSHPLYEELESNLAQFKGTEAAIIFNTGYMANVGTISAIMNKNDVIFSDALNHASIIDGCRLSGAKRVIFPHSDMTALKKILESTKCTGKRLIIVDGVFSMDGDIAPLPQLVKLAKQYDCLLMVDDAHATGILGNGHGTAAYFGLIKEVDIQMGTLSKALGSEGAYIAGKKDLIAYLMNKARSYIFSTALSPADIGAANAAVKILMQSARLPEKVLANAAFMRSALKMQKIKVGGEITPILPIQIGPAELAVKVADQLKEKGVILSAIRPPTVPVGESRLRLTVNAKHSQSDLKQAAVTIAETIQQIKG